MEDWATKPTAQIWAAANRRVSYIVFWVPSYPANIILFAASVDSITEGDRRALMGGDLPASSTYSGALSYHYPQAGLIRRSLPNMAHSMLVHEPAKIYPYHLLLITNYRLPSDVDRCNLEVGSYDI